MPQVKFSTSVLGARIQPKIESFLKANADFQASATEGKIEDAAEAISHAIAYALNLALSGSELQAATAVMIAPPPVPPSAVTAGLPTMGQLAFNALKPTITETM